LDGDKIAALVVFDEDLLSLIKMSPESAAIKDSNPGFLLS